MQPLNGARIEDYLRTAGPSFAGVQTALHQEQALQELATTPLMLSVLLLTYRGNSPRDIAKPGTELERQVWMDYVTRQVAEKGTNIRYPLERTQASLVAHATDAPASTDDLLCRISAHRLACV